MQYINIVGVIGANASGSGLPCENQPITNRLALVCGTSTCHMAVSYHSHCFDNNCKDGN